MEQCFPEPSLCVRTSTRHLLSLRSLPTFTGWGPLQPPCHRGPGGPSSPRVAMAESGSSPKLPSRAAGGRWAVPTLPRGACLAEGALRGCGRRKGCLPKLAPLPLVISVTSRVFSRVLLLLFYFFCEVSTIRRGRRALGYDRTSLAGGHAQPTPRTGQDAGGSHQGSRWDSKTDPASSSWGGTPLKNSQAVPARDGRSGHYTVGVPGTPLTPRKM